MVAVGSVVGTGPGVSVGSGVLVGTVGGGVSDAVGIKVGVGTTRVISADAAYVVPNAAITSWVPGVAHGAGTWTVIWNWPLESGVIGPANKYTVKSQNRFTVLPSVGHLSPLTMMYTVSSPTACVGSSVM